MAATVFLDLPGELKMPAIGLGTWQSADEEELETSLNYALEVGYRHIDTAYYYQNEHVIGRVINSWIKLGKLTRDELFITTKLPLIGVNPDRVEKYMKKSLENLQLDFVDLYLVHFPVCVSETDDTPEPTDHVAVWAKMEEQVQAGRTKTIGVSNFNVRQIAKVLKSCRIKPCNLQVELHVYLQQRKLVNYCQENGIAVTAYAPLGSPGYNKFLNTMGQEAKPLPNMLEDPVIKSIAEKHGKTNAQIMLRFLVERKIAAIPKSVTKARLKQNIDVFDFALDKDDMNKLNGLEVGEDARVCDFKLFKGFQEHPEFPFK